MLLIPLVAALMLLFGMCAMASTLTMPSKVKMPANGTFDLSTGNAKPKKIKWKSSNKKIATVSKKGLVKAKKAGKVTITAKQGKKKAKCTIVVTAQKPTCLKSTNKSIKMDPKATARLIVLAEPVNMHWDISWKITDASIARIVYTRGVLKIFPKKVGKTTVIAKCGNLKFTAFLEVAKTAPGTPPVLLGNDKYPAWGMTYYND